jgi:acetyl-CoA synthetase
MVEGRDFFVNDLLKRLLRRRVEPEQMPAEDPLFLMYTSGTTGKPKGCQHGTGGYLAYVTGTSKYVQDIHPEDVYWCMADIGWITGHSYIVYGPLSLCASTVIYEGFPPIRMPDAPGASPRTWMSISSTRRPRPFAPCARSARMNRPNTTTISNT